MKYKHFLPLCVCAFFFCGISWAQEATAVYVEGDTTRKDSGGVLRKLDFGDGVRAGESIITKRNGKAELELPNRSSITVRPDTVFIIGEADLAGGGKQPVLTTSIGSAAFRLNVFSANAPLIQSNSTVAGIRGTEFEIFAGMDGSTLVAVTECQVDLHASGHTVSLLANEAVEVAAGQPPGEKYSWLGKEQDFSDWNANKTEDFLKDPMAGIQRVERQLEYFRDEMMKLLPDFEAVDAESKAGLEKFQSLREAGETTKAEELRQHLIGDVNFRWGRQFLNIRYYALSYLSMRRFVLGGMYVEMKSRYFMNQEDALFQDFIKIYNSIVRNFEEVIVPHLVEEDI